MLAGLSPLCAPVGSGSGSNGPSACANAVPRVVAAGLADAVLADAGPGVAIEVLSELGSAALLCVLETPAAAGAGCSVSGRCGG